MSIEPDLTAPSPALVRAFLHEARNVAFGLSVTLDALQEEPAPGAAIFEHAPALLASAGRTSRLMNELVAYLAPVVPERAPIDLFGSLRAVTAEVAPLWALRRLSVQLPGSPHPAFFMGDARLVHQALCVLLHGVEFLAPGTGNIIFSATVRRELASLFLDVSVVAPAEVAPERLATLFEPFALRSPRFTGFSLALAYRSLVAQGVRVVVTSPSKETIDLCASFPLADP